VKIAGGLAAVGLVGFGIKEIVDHEENENDRISRLEREEREDRYNGKQAHRKKKMPRKVILSKYIILIPFLLFLDNRGYGGNEYGGGYGGGNEYGGGYSGGGGGYGGGTQTEVINNDGWFGRDSQTVITQSKYFNQVILFLYSSFYY
jgi:hypothetical protein